MINKFLLHNISILLFSVSFLMASGQGAMCVQMEGFCTDSGAAFPASVNTYAEPGNTYGCLSTQPNPAWYYFEIATGGDLIIQLTNSQNVDIDFIAYGPFPDLAAAQSNCGSLFAGTDPFGCDYFSSTCPNGVPCDFINPCPTGQAVDCSYDPQSVEVVDILNTQVGEVYILLITNFSNLPTDIFATQIAGTASTDCSVVCPTVGFYDITANSPMDCNDPPLALQAFDATDANGFITPGFDFAIMTDLNSNAENTLEFFDGPNGTGNSFGIFPLGSVPNDNNWSIFGEYYEAGMVFSAVWCDTGNDGSFDYSVTDHASGTILTSGTILGSNGCTTINFGPLTGMAIFSGPGVTNLGDGTGFFDPAAAGDGLHTITYSWDDGQGCSGSDSQIIEVTGCQVCTADAGTFTTPNGVVICFGDNFVISSNNDYAGSFETGDNMDMPLPDGALGGPLDGIPDADGDGVNGVVYGLYSAPPAPYILNDPNLLQTIGSEPTGLFGNGTFTNIIGGNTQYWATTSYAFDEDLAGSMTAIVGFDIGNDGTIDCFDTNQADAVMITLLDEIQAPFSQTCNAAGDAVDISFTISGGLPGFDGSPFTVSGDGPGGMVSNGGIYTILNHPPNTPFSITVDDDNGCQMMFSGMAIDLPSVMFSVVQDASCNGSADGNLSVVASGGSSPYTYSWSHDLLLNSPDASNLDPGNYSVTVADQNGCTAVNSTLVGAVVTIDPAGMITDILCGGTNTGSITLNPSGSPNLPFSFTWSANAATGNSATASNLAADTYFVTVTDDAGCFETASFVINEPALLTVAPFIVNNISCAGVSDGAASANPMGGIPGYTFLWSPSAGGQTTDIATGLSAGTHSVTATDANGCTTMGDVTFTDPAPVMVSISVLNQVSCNGLSDGSAQAMPVGGALPYTFFWENGETTDIATMLDQGNHVVTVTDANGCQGTESIVITEPSALQVSLTGANPTCNGSSDGSILGVAAGGTMPYTFLWNDGQTDAIATSLSAGNFSLTISDAGGCSLTASTTLSEPSPITAVVTSQSPGCITACNGQASVVVSGGSGSYTFSWDNGEVGPDPVFLCPGPQSVTITDQDGCSVVENFEVVPPAPIIPDMISTSPASCNGGDDGSATFIPAGGTTPYTFTWTDAAGTPILTETGAGSTLTGLPAGVYFVEVTDANGCFLPPISLTVNEPAMPVSLTTSGTGPVCNGGDDGFVSVDPVGGTPSYNYQWDAAAGGQTTQTVFDLEAGSYLVTVTDANGCIETGSVTIAGPEPILAGLSSEGVVCFGDANGSITVDTAFGGTGPYIYSLDGEVYTASNFFAGLTGGLYTTYVQDVNGCEFSGEILIDEPAEIVVNAGSDVVVDLGDSTQIVTQVNVFEPDSLTYIWSPPSGLSCIDCPDPVARPAETTAYTIQVIDSLGCIGEDEIIVTVDKSRDVYIPNVFTPNGDGINDNFMIFGGIGVTNINVLKIYDRWGELMFEASDFQPNDPFFSWDGRLNGKKLNPSVFVYFAEVSFFDGVTIPYKGDITLLK